MNKSTKGIILATASAALAVSMLAGCSSQGAGLSCRQPVQSCKGMNACKGRAVGNMADMHANSCGAKPAHHKHGKHHKRKHHRKHKKHAKVAPADAAAAPAADKK